MNEWKDVLASPKLFWLRLGQANMRVADRVSLHLVDGHFSSVVLG
jgi:hypothetical protein